MFWSPRISRINPQSHFEPSEMKISSSAVESAFGAVYGAAEPLKVAEILRKVPGEAAGEHYARWRAVEDAEVTVASPHRYMAMAIPAIIPRQSHGGRTLSMIQVNAFSPWDTA